MSREVEAALEAAGAVFVRRGKHMIYKLRNGSQISISTTPSCYRSVMNTVAMIRRESGTVREVAPVTVPDAVPAPPSFIVRCTACGTPAGPRRADPSRCQRDMARAAGRTHRGHRMVIAND